MADSANEDFCDAGFSSISNLSYLGWLKVPVISLVTLVLSYLLYKLMLRFCTKSVQLSGNIRGACMLTQDHVLYLSLLTWLAKTIPDFQTIKTTIDVDDSDDEDEDDSNERLAPEQRPRKLEHSPGYGTHYFQYKGSWIRLQRVSTPRVLFYHDSQELITLTTFRWNSATLFEILEAIKPKPTPVSEKKLVLYKADKACSYWMMLGQPKKKRPLNTIILDGELVQKLMTDVTNFLSLEDWYVERGIPYRRGYLLYGPPGCGKSSVIKALAGHLGYDICILSLSQGLSDDSLTELLNLAPTKSIVLLEDIDAAFKSREDPASTSRETNLAFEGCSPSTLTFRGLLNALDGVASAEDGQLLFMTTNYPERLDPALVRPGRVDLKVFIDYPNDLQLERMFKRFYPEAELELMAKFLTEVRSLDMKISMAMVQGLFLMNKDSAEEAVRNVKEYFESPYSSAKDFVMAN